MNDEWATPSYLFDPLNEEFGFAFDLCANAQNTKCKGWTDDIEDFVARGGVEHGKVYWMNPPYSRGKIGRCMQAAVEVFARGGTVVCLVRDDPTTDWYKNYVNGVATEVRRLPERIVFGNATVGYNFPVCVVVYKDRDPKYFENYFWVSKNER